MSNETEVIIFEDDENMADAIANGLNQRFESNGLPARAVAEYDDWHEIADEKGHPGANMIWLIDICAATWLGKEEERSAWLAAIIERHEHLRVIYQRETLLLAYDHLGVGIAIRARECGIPFAFTSRVATLSGNLLQTLCGSYQLHDYSFEKQALGCSIPDRSVDREYDRLLRFIKGNMRKLSIEVMTAEDWREMRGAAHHPEGQMVAKLVSANPEWSDEVKATLECFHPRHTATGGAPSRSYPPPELYVRYLFPERIRSMLEQDLKYAWNMEFDSGWEESFLMRPPGRALLQNTAEARDLSACVSKWRRSVEQAGIAPISEFHVDTARIERLHDYLWLNLPTVLEALQTSFLEHKEDAEPYRFVFMQRNWEEENQSAKNMPHGLLICCYLNLKRPYNKEFPHRRNGNEPTDGIKLLLERAIRNGALWLVHAARSDVQSSSFKWHALLPVKTPQMEMIWQPQFHKSVWGSDREPPTLTIFIPAEVVASPFRNDAEFPDDDAQCGQVPLSKDRLLNEANRWPADRITSFLESALWITK